MPILNSPHAGPTPGTGQWVEIAMEEPNHTELNEILRAILIGGSQTSSDY